MKKILLMTTAVAMSATSSFATDLSTIAAVKSAISTAYAAAGGSATGGDAHVAIIEPLAINQVGTVKSETVDYASFGWGASTDVSIGTNVGVEFITEAEVAVEGISITGVNNIVNLQKQKITEDLTGSTNAGFISGADGVATKAFVSLDWENGALKNSNLTNIGGLVGQNIIGINAQSGGVRNYGKTDIDTTNTGSLISLVTGINTHIDAVIGAPGSTTAYDSAYVSTTVSSINTLVDNLDAVSTGVVSISDSLSNDDNYQGYAASETQYGNGD